jgi:hypothetical protein
MIICIGELNFETYRARHMRNLDIYNASAEGLVSHL